MNPLFWQDRRVLVTGHTGFKGAWLCSWLQLLGADLTGFSLQPPTDPNLFEQAAVAENMHSITGDIRNSDLLSATLSDAKPEIVIHLAAQSLVRESYRDPSTTFSTNVMGTVNLLNAIRKMDCTKAVLIVTSDKCYQNNNQTKQYVETDPMGGSDPYSCSKGCAELVTSAYRDSFLNAKTMGRDIGLASSRSGNVIGGGDWSEDRLVPDCFRSLTSGDLLTVRSPSAVRPWQHVLDALMGYMLLIENLWNDPSAYSQAWNFGPDKDSCISVSAVVTKLHSLWGTTQTWNANDNDHGPAEAQMLRLDSSKARQHLQWTPVLPFDAALSLTVDWFKQYAKGANAKNLTITQIQEYMNKL